MQHGDRIIDLNSKPYVLASPVEVSVVEEWPTQYRTTGLQQRDDRANVSQWVINQFLGGARADKWYQPLDAARYSASTADTRFADHIGPALLEVDGTVSGAVAAALTVKNSDSGNGSYGYTATSRTLNEVYRIWATSGTEVTNTSIGPALGTGYGTVATGTGEGAGTVLGSPVTLVRGFNTITMGTDGTCTLTVPTGGAAGSQLFGIFSGTTTVSGSPVYSVATSGSVTIDTESGTPGGTFNIYVYKAEDWVPTTPLSFLGSTYCTLYDYSSYTVPQYCVDNAVIPVPLAASTYATGALYIVHMDYYYVYLASTASNIRRYVRTTGAESTAGWTTAPTIPFIIYQPTTLCAGTYNNEAATFCTSGRMLSVTTATGAIAAQEFLYYLPIMPTAMCYWSGYLFITDGTSVFRYKIPSTYTLAELDIISDVGGNIVPGATINQLIPTTDGVYAVNGTTIHKWYNDSWHYITSAHAGSSYQSTFLYGTYPSNYLLQTYDTAPATVVSKSNRYADLNRFVSGGTFAASSTLTTPIFGGGMDEISGTFFKLRCVGSLSTTETIAVTYGLDGAAATTTSLGTFNSTTKELTIGVTGKTIQFKFTFARGSTTTAFPDASYFILDYLKQPTARLEYKFNIDVEATVSELKRDPATLYEELTTDFNAAPMTLKWNGSDKTVKVLGVKSAMDAKANKLTAQSVPRSGAIQVWCMDVP